jgi:hypothetical protein
MAHPHCFSYRGVGRIVRKVMEKPDTPDTVEAFVLKWHLGGGCDHA